MATLPHYPDHWQASLNWQPDDRLLQRFQTLYDALQQANQQLNLTRITAPEDFWEKHLWDSLQGVGAWLTEPSPSPQRVIDIGTGGGFPGLPVALVFPQWSITLLDATQKKIAALTDLYQALGFSNVVAQAQRVEALAHQPDQRETYDLALLRAIAGANTSAEYALPLLRLGGQAVLYRGQWSGGEEASLAAILPDLGGEIAAVQARTTPLTGAQRHNILLTKVSPTPDRYPRSVGIPTKSPLGQVGHRNQNP
ncbi:MAG: 16S rRNA (guanine(527)-N(7))-methyltransferase RsmG [Nodosilinea sp.]